MRLSSTAFRAVRAAVVGTALVIATPWIVSVEDATATTVAPLTIEQLTDASAYIVRGTVTEVWTEAEADGDIWTRARIAVDEVYKGPDSPTELVVGSIGGSVDGTTALVWGAARYSVTEDVILFVSENKSGRLATVAMGKGKYTVRRAPGEKRPYAMTVDLDPRVHYDARFLPHPAFEHRLYVDDLVAQIQARLAVGWDGQPIPGISNDELARLNTPDRRLRR